MEWNIEVKGLSKGASKVVQSAGGFHEMVGDVVLMQAQGVFDNAAAFDSRQGMFDGHPNTGDDAVQQFGRGTQGLSSFLFWGCRVNTPCGS